MPVVSADAGSWVEWSQLYLGRGLEGWTSKLRLRVELGAPPVGIIPLPAVHSWVVWHMRIEAVAPELASAGLSTIHSGDAACDQLSNGIIGCKLEDTSQIVLVLSGLPTPVFACWAELACSAGAAQNIDLSIDLLRTAGRTVLSLSHVAGSCMMACSMLLVASQSCKGSWIDSRVCSIALLAVLLACLCRRGSETSASARWFLFSVVLAPRLTSGLLQWNASRLI